MSHHQRPGTRPWLFAIAAVAACQAFAPIPAPVAFTFQSGANSSIVLVSVRNTGSDVVFLQRCGDHMLPAIDRLSGGVWTNAAAGMCLTDLRMDPFPLEVGAVYQDSLSITQPGTYRLRLEIVPGSLTAQSELVASQSFATDY